MKHIVLFTALLTLLSAAACKPEPQPPRMAVINVRDVLTRSNAGLKAVEDVQRQFADRRADLKAREEALRKQQEDSAQNDPKAGRKSALQQLVQAYAETSQQLRRDVAEAEATRFKPVADRIDKVLAEYSKEHGLLSIQDKAGFAYVDPSIDITEEIIRRVDQSN